MIEAMQIPRVLFGAGRYAGLAITLMQWMGWRLSDLVLYDDCYPVRKIGPGGYPIVGRMEDGLQQCATNPIPAFIALGSRTAALRYKLYLSLIRAGVPLVNVVHDSCVISPDVQIGRNVMLMPSGAILSGVSIGSMCWFFARTTIEHDCTIGDNVVCGPGVTMAGCVTIGPHAFIGAGAVVCPEIAIGARALIGAGAVVVSDVPDGLIAFGVPARARRVAPAGLDVPTADELLDHPGSIP